MTSNQQKLALIFLGLSVFITALLAASLSQMELKPGLPAPFLEGYQIVLPEYDQSDDITLEVFPFILRFLGILFSLYLMVMLYKVIMGMRLRKLLGSLREFILIIGGFLLLIVGIFLLQNLPGQPAARMSSPRKFDTPLAIRTEPIPTGLLWFVGISLAVLAAGLLYYWIRAQRSSRQGTLLAGQIEKARQNILAGMELDEVILRCYVEMGLILQRERGIERQVFTTPTEFERELILSWSTPGSGA